MRQGSRCRGQNWLEEMIYVYADPVGNLRSAVCLKSKGSPGTDITSKGRDRVIGVTHEKFGKCTSPLRCVLSPGFTINLR
jgi:hypothetical protein